MSDITALIARIARERLDIETLAVRNCDRLDFHTLAVWEIEQVLCEAFLAGRKQALARQRVAAMLAVPDQISNGFRATRARLALNAYRAATGDAGTSPDEDVIDLLCDLRHYADTEELCFGNCDTHAHDHYLAELDEAKGDASAAYK